MYFYSPDCIFRSVLLLRFLFVNSLISDFSSLSACPERQCMDLSAPKELQGLSVPYIERIKI